MSESFLHYVWQLQYFRKDELKTTHGEAIQIFKPGLYNTHAGPDFLHARVKVGELEWNGHVELHVAASDWLAHKHQHDQAYDNVVLHVVWDADAEILRSDGTTVPCLELKNRVAESLLLAYKNLVHSADPIPCHRGFRAVPEIFKNTMRERVVVERLEQKADQILQILATNQQDWEQTTYQLLARNFGFKVNAEPFARLAEVTPWRLIARYRDKPRGVEALLFGMSGFLETPMTDEYHSNLREEFQILQSLHSLSPLKMKAAAWRFLRLRPANFPTVRLAQFSAWLCQQTGLHSPLIEASSIVELSDKFRITAPEYWQNHYRFGKKARAYQPVLGQESIDNLIINTVAPLQAAAGKWYGQPELIERACLLLQQIPAEKNKITRLWNELDWKTTSAYDSQGAIQLYREYCEKRQCLNCVVGNQVLKPAHT
jgi:hypothetical protein